ncbi:MAG TPA: hypothetical protein VK569_04135 [Bacteroidota bacterium]|nr:hypothetical protein [Bacteroidota bacterium]
MKTPALSRFALLVATAVLIALTPALGQKKKAAPAPAPAAQSETHPSQKPAGTIRDILTSLQGQHTNLGVLSKITGDYVVFESEGDTLMYPLLTLQVVKFLKVDEGDPRKIEIRFLSKD